MYVIIQISVNTFKKYVLKMTVQFFLKKTAFVIMLMNKRQFRVDPIQTKYYICSIRRHKNK